MKKGDKFKQSGTMTVLATLENEPESLPCPAELRGRKPILVQWYQADMDSMCKAWIPSDVVKLAGGLS